jgi:methyl-accepting chemotaxis protein
MLNSLENQTNNNLKVLDSYTHNDYTAKVNYDTGFSGKQKELSDNINLLGQTLRDNTKENLENGTVLQHNSQVLKENVLILTTSSEEQSAAILQTSHTIEELTNSVKDSSDKTDLMKNFTTTLTQTVEEGDKLSNQTADVMDEIYKSTSTINEAIESIDQISFQTNILSLNAAVEAATAGESGKGFAVVAGEVRNLASRSAESAKDIKDLVNNAQEKATHGNEVSIKMKDGYHNLNKEITKTVAAINELADTTYEQMSKIASVNDAIKQLDIAIEENVKIASNTNQIAIDTEELSNKLVEDTKTIKI